MGLSQRSEGERGQVSASTARVNVGGSQYIFGDFLVIFSAGDVYIQWTEQGDSEQHGRTPKMESGCATALVNG